MDIDQVPNVINKENKVRNIGFLFGFYYYNYLQNIIQTFNRTKFYSKWYQLQKRKQNKYVKRIWYMIKTLLSHKEVVKAETEYTKWTKDLLEIEYSFESKYFIGHKTFSDY